MKRLFALLVAVIAMASLVIAGCSQAAPEPTKAPAAPTSAPAAPTKAPAAPTKAAAAPTQAPAKPTAAPAKQADWPQKGKTITVIVPISAGGATDVVARLVAAEMEKELGTPVQVVNKPGGGQQVGMTEVSMAKPDGYTLGVFVPTSVIGSYLDPARKAVYTRKSFDALSLLVADPLCFAVKNDSPFKTLKDLVDSAKANPEKVKIAAGMFQSTFHLMLLDLERMTGAKLAIVNFEGGAPGRTALLGGHVDASVNTTSELLPQIKAGELRVLGVADQEKSKYYPDAQTATEQGYKLNYATTIAMAGPAGLPKEVKDTLVASLKKIMASDAITKKMDTMALSPRYMDPAQFNAYWDETETMVKPLLEMAKAK